MRVLKMVVDCVGSLPSVLFTPPLPGYLNRHCDRYVVECRELLAVVTATSTHSPLRLPLQRPTLLSVTSAWNPHTMLNASIRQE